MTFQFCSLRNGAGAAVVAFVLLLALPCTARPRHRAPAADEISRDPYIGAIALDPSSGRVLWEENADTPGYPASVIKLMNLLIVLEAAEKGKLQPADLVTVTAESARTGGSQVYLKEKEVFPVEDLLFALMVQSANDAATALAIHVAGSKQAFVDRMNGKAVELGLTSTRFHSVHGLPPSAGQSFDQSTARDIANLARAAMRYPATLRYSATRERLFRDGKFSMRNHNHLLGEVAGCDGLKTGYIRAGGFSIAATAERGGRRVLVVVLGSKDRKVRDRKAAELIDRAFGLLGPGPVPPPGGAPAVAVPPGASPVAGLPVVAGVAGVPVPDLLPPGAPQAPAPVVSAAAGAVALAVPGTPVAPLAASGAPLAPVADPQPPVQQLNAGSRAWLWGAGGLAAGLVLGYLLFGRRRR